MFYGVGPKLSQCYLIYDLVIGHEHYEGENGLFDLRMLLRAFRNGRIKFKVLA